MNAAQTSSLYADLRAAARNVVEPTSILFDQDHNSPVTAEMYYHIYPPVSE